MYDKKLPIRMGTPEFEEYWKYDCTKGYGGSKQAAINAWNKALKIGAALVINESAQTANNISRVEICDWKVNGTDTYYHTTCGEIVQSILDIEGMNFCPYCGGKLRHC